MFESFNQSFAPMGGHPTPSPTPNRAFPRTAGLEALLAASDAVKRRVIITWVQDNIVALVGSDAALVLATILNNAAVTSDTTTFVRNVLWFQIQLQRGVQTADQAVADWQIAQRAVPLPEPGQ